MAHDVFVSYSSQDKPTADAACAVLETHGIRCWIAPRDIMPGKDWGAAIVEAIRGARLMVLVFSAHANGSPQINREVERAVSRGIPIIPLRIEDVAPTDSLEYFISTPHWLDAFTPPLEHHLQYLAQITLQILQGPAPTSGPVSTPEALAREKRSAEAITTPAPERKVAALVAGDQNQNAPEPARPKAVAVSQQSSVGQNLAAREGFDFSGPSKLPDPPNVAPQPPTHPTKHLGPVIGAVVMSISIVLVAGWWFGIEQPRRERERRLATREPTPSTQEAAKPTIRVVPDQYSTVQAAIDAARPGDTVKVKTGTYLESLHLVEGIDLIGEGRESVRVRSPATANALNCNGIKKAFISGMTFEHAYKGAENDSARFRYFVVSLSDGCAVEITDCRIQAGDGNGIGVRNASPRIADCVLQENGWNGIRVEGTNAHPQIVHNQCRDNNQNGIQFWKGASGEAQGNVCEGNRWSGITAEDPGTAPALRANQCRGHPSAGIGFGSGAAGKAQENVCENNRGAGIIVAGSGTAPVLRANRCSGNGYGIRFWRGAAGEALENVCEKNKGCGIEVIGVSTAPRLVSNVCRDNALYGIGCESGSSPTVISNLPFSNQKGFSGTLSFSAK